MGHVSCGSHGKSCTQVGTRWYGSQWGQSGRLHNVVFRPLRGCILGLSFVHQIRHNFQLLVCAFLSVDSFMSYGGPPIPPPTPHTHSSWWWLQSMEDCKKKKKYRFSGSSPKESDFVVLGGLWKSSEKESKWPSLKNLQITNAGEVWRKGKPPTLLEGM